MEDSNAPIDIPKGAFFIFAICSRPHIYSLISGFRENKKYIFFSFEPSAYVLYNKESKNTKAFYRITDSNTNINIYNLFSHDGLYNGIVSIMNPIDVITRLEYLQKKDIETKDINVINLQKNIEANNNPIIFKYAFK